ncbi:MAG: flagellar biosynthesis protein FlhB [Anaerolinea sp.]|nr:flagellar biosynthesis protein FlhB [Anaerolinea sp.]
MAGERTEPATPRRRQEARGRGEVAKSDEVVSIGVLLVAVVGMRLAGPAAWQAMGDILREGLMHPPREELTRPAALQLGKDAASKGLLALMPLVTMLALAAVALNLAQSGLILSGAKLKPKLSHINPGAGAKRMVSKEAAVRFAKSLAKMGVVSIVVYMVLKSRMAELSALGELGVAPATARLAALSFDIAIWSASVLFILALAEYAWQRRQHSQRLRMTKEELKQEIRESDGDPQINAAIRRRRMSLLNRMMASVPNADVVVTNPTHYAVALKYDPVTMQAPMVVAKGEALLALRIREVAKKAGVPVLEEPPLARALFAAVPVGQYIPANLFHAVAEVLAWVYALRTKTPLVRRAPARATTGGEA